MKLQIFALVLAVFLIFFVIGNSIALSYNIDKLISALEAIPDDPKSLSEYETLRDDFMRRQRFISLTVSHDDLTEIEITLSEIVGAAKADDKESLIITKSRLLMSLSHLKRLSGINIDSIL